MTGYVPGFGLTESVPSDPRTIAAKDAEPGDMVRVFGRLEVVESVRPKVWVSFAGGTEALFDADDALLVHETAEEHAAWVREQKAAEEFDAALEMLEGKR